MRRASQLACAALGAAGAAEAFYGPLPFARSVRPSSLPAALMHDVQPGSAHSYAVELTAHSLGPTVSIRRPGSNYGKLDERAALACVQHALRAHASPAIARLLPLPESVDDVELAETHVRARSSDGLLVLAWVSVNEPRWVGDDLNLVVHICCAIDAGHAPPWWRALAAPRRYAAICALAACERQLRVSKA